MHRRHEDFPLDGGRDGEPIDLLASEVQPLPIYIKQKFCLKILPLDGTVSPKLLPDSPNRNPKGFE
jgi:hypothetical protein